MKTSKNIQAIIFDIDGVFTDGTVLISEDGKESKRINFKDIDAFFQIKREGYKTAFITGESTPLALWFNKRFNPDYFYSGCKNKAEAVREIIKKTGLSAKKICYIGDSRHDIPGFNAVGLKVCPQNASEDVKKICDIVLHSCGGNGAIAELLEFYQSEK